MAHPLIDNLAELASRELADATSLPPAIYHDADIAALEHDKIWKTDWVCPGLAAEIPNTGDYLTYSIAGEAIYCIRDKSGSVKTYSNVCRHRMMQLVQGRGNKSRVTCPYHAWTYDLNGKLVGAGHMNHSNGFKKSDICLPEIRTEIWNGWIYCTLNPDAPSVADALADLEDVVGRYNMQGYIPVAQQDHAWDTNWKLLCENFMEGYHLPVAHKATVGAWFPVEDTVFPDEIFD
ncbi:MAG: aromatic ring-hydroxylating oxygenase subunit alpha, partial [Planktomarina sp.]